MTFTLYEDIGLAPEIARHAWDIPEGEDVDIRINSCGGSVFGGMAIVAAISTLRWHGHKTRAIVEGLAASMASVVACACDELQMHEGSMLMIHNPWTLIEGDAEELKKQAALMEKVKHDMVAVYMRKFDISADEISRLMDEETWISTEDIEQYELDATVIEGTAKIAASVTKERYYATLKERAAMTKAEVNKEDKEDKTEEQKPAEKPAEKTDEKPAEDKPAEKTEEKPAEQKPTEEKPAEQKPTEEKPAEEKPADDKDKAEDEDKDEDNLEKLRERIAELEKENEELKRQLDAPVEDRVRGMQSKMQSRINAAQKEFEKQLRAKTEELATAQAKATSLQAELDKTKGELQTTASALAAKTTALETLHSGVLTPHAATPTPKTRDEARRALAKLPMSARAEYYKQHRDLIDG